MEREHLEQEPFPQDAMPLAGYGAETGSLGLAREEGVLRRAMRNARPHNEQAPDDGHGQSDDVADVGVEASAAQAFELSSEERLALECHILSAEATARTRSLDETLEYVRSRCVAIASER